MKIKMKEKKLYKDKHGTVYGPFRHDGLYWRTARVHQPYCEDGTVHPDWETTELDLVEEIDAKSYDGICIACGRAL